MVLLPREFVDNDAGEMGFDPAPAGKYPMTIVKSELVNCKETAKDPNGKYIKLQMKILEGKYKNKVAFTQLNIINKNSTAVEIAYKELNTILKACGFSKPVNDTEKLHGIPMLVTLAVEEATANFPAKNVATDYKPIDGHPAEKAEQEPSNNSEENTEKKKPWD